MKLSVFCGAGARFGLALASIASFVLIWSHAVAQERVGISSPEQLLEFFDSIGYTPEAWQAGIRDVPRAYVTKIGPGWQINSKNIAVINKKRIFFRALGPLALRANELIRDDRKRLIEIVDAGDASGEDAAWLQKLAATYKVVDSSDSKPTKAEIAELVRRVDAVPVSLVLAQGAEESGWGTSRFAAEGNALFGQWTWGGKGIRPKGQRSGMGDYRIAAFDTPLESVQAYMRNINTHASYAPLRARRAKMQDAGKALSGWELAGTLTSYSERGEEYVKTLHSIMRVNKLQAADEAKLIDGKEWHLHPARQ